MISCGVEISIAGGGGEMVCGLSRGHLFFSLFFFFLFFLNHVLLVKVQELACIVRYGINKTLIANNRPLHHFMGKIKHPKSIGKIPLA